MSVRHPSMLVLTFALLGCRPVPATVDVDPASAPADAPQVFVEAEHDEAAGDRPAAGYAPISADYAELYACWFESPYEYMFELRGEPLIVDGRRFGMMMAGISGILYYGDFNECAGRLSGQQPRSYSDYGPIEALAGVSATVPSSLEFDAVNPEFVAWARRELLPPPDQLIAGLPVQMAYDRVFQRFFRAMAESYAWLAETYPIDAEASDYLAATRAGAYGVEWLERRYAAIPIQDAYADGTMMTGQMAAGFWLRRTLDGSAAACWHALREVVERYDATWYAELGQAYPKGMGALAQLADPHPPK